MKPKPQKHKQENRYKFQTQDDHRRSIMENLAKVIIKAKKSYTETEEDQRLSRFHKVLEEWTTLNCTNDFDQFTKLIDFDNVRTLPQVVLLLDDLVAILKEGLRAPNNNALDAILKFIEALASDTLHLFAPHFPEIFHLIQDKIKESQDTQEIGRMFETLLNILKILRKSLMEDPAAVYRLFSQLLVKTNAKLQRIVHEAAARCLGHFFRWAPDKEPLFRIFLQDLKDQPKIAPGLGLVIFEAMQNIHQQFHHCAHAQILPLLMDNLLESEAVLELSKDVVSRSAQFTTQENGKPLFLTFIKRIKLLIGKLTAAEDHETTEVQFSRVIQMFLPWLEYKSGLLVPDQNLLMEVYTSLFGLPYLAPLCREAALKLSQCVLLAQNLKLEATQYVKALQQVLEHKNIPVPELLQWSREFISALSKQPSADSEIAFRTLAGAILRVDDWLSTAPEEAAEVILEFLAQSLLVLYPELLSCEPLPPSRVTVDKFPFHHKEASNLRTLIRDVVKRGLLDQSHVARLWSALIILPFISLSEISEEDLRALTLNLKQLIQENPSMDHQMLLMALIQSFSTPEYFTETLGHEFFMAILKNSPKSIPTLQIVAQYIGLLNEDQLSTEELPQILELLKPNLASPYHKIRFLTLKIILPFSKKLIPENGKNIVEICLNTEPIALAIDDYREYRARLNSLTQIEHERILPHLPSPDWEAIGLLYLLGNLTINLRLLWADVKLMIKTYATGMGSRFWEVFFPFLSDISEACREEDEGTEVDSQNQPMEVEISPLHLYFNSTCRNINVNKEKFNPYGFRWNLWTAMEHFADLAEQHNRDLVPLFLDVVSKELQPLQDIMGRTQNLLRNDDSSETLPPEIEEEEEENDDDESSEDEGEQESKEEQKQRHSKAFNNLAVMLLLFSKFHNPRALHREPEVKELYYHLLTFRQHKGIDQLAFACIQTYKEPYISPYKENILKLMDDKTFKDEIVQFNLDSNTLNVDPAHRLPLLQVLMRILMGKYIHRTAKGGGNQRRSIILRFLAGCKVEELQIFLDLLFQPVQPLVKDDQDIYAALQSLKSSLDISKVIPIGRLARSLSTMESILDQIGNLSIEMVPQLLKLLVLIGYHAVGILQHHRDQVRPNCLNLLKNLRTTALQALNKFFKVFVSYEFAPNEIEAIFEGLIVPMLPHLETHSLSTPSPLLQVLRTFTTQPRFFRLLSHGSDPAINHVVSLYAKPALQSSMLTFLTGMFHRLVANDEGLAILQPHLKTLLERLKLLLADNLSKKTYTVLSTEEQTILLKISAHVDDPELCGTLSTLLVTLLAKSKSKPPKASSNQDIAEPKISPVRQEFETTILGTVNNLLQFVPNCGPFVKLLAPLFDSIFTQYSRSLLCNIMRTIGEKEACLAPLADIVTKLNALEKDSLDRIDLEKRFEGFRQARDFVEDDSTWKMEPEFIVSAMNTLIYNCTFDMLHQESGSFGMEQTLPQNICQKLGILPPHMDVVFSKIVCDVLMPQIYRGVRSKTRIVRIKFYTILDKLLENCSSKNAGLTNLSQLCKLPNDLNFWVEISRSKPKNHDKAITVLNSQLEDGSLKILPVFITNLLLPILRSFALDQGATEYTHLVDVAIQGIGNCCRYLPWSRYQSVLRQHLNQMNNDLDNLKVLNKINMAVLNNFHFDLTLSEVKKPKEKLPIKEKRVVEKTAEVADKEKEKEEEVAEEVEEEIVDHNSVIPEEIAAEDKPLPAQLATSIHNTIISDLLPRLHKSLTMAVHSSDGHRYAKAGSTEAQKLVKVPLAVAMVKLLKKLPSHNLFRHINSIILHLCNLLKSRDREVQTMASQTMSRCAKELGTSYLRHILNEMKSVMSRGYMTHVLIRAVHHMLGQLAISGTFTSGDLDSSAPLLLALCQEELYGTQAEEKEVDKIRAKIPEARRTHSYDIFFHLGQYCSLSTLPSILEPIHKTLSGTHSHATITKAKGCLNGLVIGISKNKGITAEEILIFIYSLLKDNISAVMENTLQEEALNWKEEKRKRMMKRDSLLLPPKPTRHHAVKAEKKTYLPILVEYIIKLFFKVLQNKPKQKLLEKEVLQMLDPFVTLLMNGLQPKHSLVTAVTLKCYLALIQLPLPAVKDNINKLINLLFNILNNFSGFSQGAPQGKNLDLVINCFKVLTQLMKSEFFGVMSEENLRVLLVYIDQDFPDHNLLGQAIELLKAILTRGPATSNEISQLMENVRTLSLSHEHEHVQAKCRQSVYLYHLKCKLSKSARQENVTFYLVNVSHEEESYKIASLEMIHTFISKFNAKSFSAYVEHFYCALLQVLSANPSDVVKEMATAELISLLSKSSESQRNTMFPMVVKLLTKEDQNLEDNTETEVITWGFGARVAACFMKAEVENFEPKFKTLLPIYAKHLEDVLQYPDNDGKAFFYENTLGSLLYAVQHCKLMPRSREHLQALNAIWVRVWGLLDYYNCVVTHLAVQLAAELLSAHTHQELEAALTSNDQEHEEFLLQDFPTHLKRLRVTLCDIVAAPAFTDAHILDAMKLLLQICVITHTALPGFPPIIIKKLAWEAHDEVVNNWEETTRRKRTFTFFGILSEKLPEVLEPKLDVILPPLIREVQNKSAGADKDLKELAEQVLQRIRDQIGTDKFDQVYVVEEKKVIRQKLKRKQEKDMEAVVNPMRFAARKLKKQKARSEAVKRKRNSSLPGKPAKKFKKST